MSTPEYIYPIIILSDSDVEDTFSSTHSPDYIPALSDYSLASPGNTSPNFSDDLTKDLLSSLSISPFHDDLRILKFSVISCNVITRKHTRIYTMSNDFNITRVVQQNHGRPITNWFHKLKYSIHPDFRYSDTIRPSRSNEVLKFKNFEKDASLKLSSYLIKNEGTVSTISGEYLLEFTSEYGILESLHPELPGPEETIVDFSEDKSNNSRVIAKMDLFSLIRNLNPFKVKTRTWPRVAHEVSLLTAMVSHVIAQERLAHEVPLVETAITTEVVQEPVLEKEVTAIGPPVNKRCCQREYPWRESLVAMGLEVGSTFTPVAQETSAGAKSISNPDPLSYAKPPPHSESSKGTDSWKSTSVLSVDGSPGGIYQPGWGVTNNYHLDTPDACQDIVDHTVPPGYFSELRHLPNTEFLGEEEIKKLDEEIKSLSTMEMEVHGLRNQTQNLETLLEAEVDMKKVAEAKNAEDP
ncbi:hypothetical protein Tco_1145822 [Tanacetum coccineum]